VLESQIENSFIRKLTADLKYVYRDDICDRQSLERNFREKFQTLNKVHLTDAEFTRLMEEITDSDVFVSSKRLRERNTFMREDGTPLQYTLVNIKDWCKNDYEVIHQLRMNTRYSSHRYDVILLINGLPVVQIELKNLDVSPRRAMQQIVDYKKDIGNGYTNSLLCFIQIFIVSNQTRTYYFANNNNTHFNFNADENYLPVYQWADEKNNKITNLDDFSEVFLAKCKLGKMISRYMVLVASEQKILMMRPYQIYAVNAIVDSINENRGNGYIWHTTGSGKTLTSFKTATLLKDNPEIDKCLFVVDRKDLDRQTREEFNRFQENCVEENTNTDALVRRMLSEDYSDKIIVTTIQKLGIALDPQNRQNYQQRLLPVKDMRMVFIFDECHRSQFGENHKAIKEFFPNSQLFGFTGTPIFEQNATYTQITGEEAQYRTTEDVFEKELHAYTITNAIDDKNVLRFHVDYFKPEDDPNIIGVAKKQAIVKTILQKHNAATNDRRFNALFATGSINEAIEYYQLFKRIQDDRQFMDETFEPLNIACVFSPPAEGNKDIMQIQEDLQQERLDNEKEPDQKKAALMTIIDDYNKQYGTNHSIEEFDAYYQDVQQRIKNQKYINKDYPHKNKIDITIVVDMLLTGFDSKYLNTLYVDKNLKYHSLVQAFSRTNRILNDTKPYGNILDFRGQQDAVDEAIALFSGEKNEEVARQVWLVEPASEIIKKLRKSESDLRNFMHLYNLEFKADEVVNLKGDKAKAGFINCFKEVQRYKTQLDQYTDLVKVNNDNAVLMTRESDETDLYGLISDDELRAFRGAYLDVAKELKTKREKNGTNVLPEVEDLDFEFVLFASALIDYDYIMELITRYVGAPSMMKLTKEQLKDLVCSSANLIDDREDIMAYIDSLDAKGVNGKTEKEIRDGYELFKTEKFVNELMDIAEKHQLDIASMKTFVDDIVERKIFDGEKLNNLLAPLGLGWKDRIRKEDEIMKDLIPLLKRMVSGQKISGLSAYEM
jgi:type I restriction enzyme R subunit